MATGETEQSPATTGPELVSVLIPTYNRCGQVLEAIETARRQTYPRTEIIVVDDGSSDETPDVVGRLPHVRYVQQSHAGPATARNRGLEVARGGLIASLDSDDLWDPEFVARSVQALTDTGADFVFSNWSSQSARASYLSHWARSGRLDTYCHEQRGDWWVLQPTDVRRLFLDACLAPSSSLLLRRSSMPARWNPKMRIADDWYLILEMILLRPRRAAFTTTPLWLKRVDDESRYDSLSFRAKVSRLYMHDVALMSRDFQHFLSRRERLRFAVRRTGYPALLDSMGRALELLPWEAEISLRRILGR